MNLRYLARHRTLSVVAILTTALAVGANTVIFSVVRAVFLRPLGLPAESRLVMIRECNEAWHQKLLQRGHSPADDRGCISASGAIYRDFLTQANSYQTLGAMNFSTEMVALTGSAEPLLVSGYRVTPSLFPVLGVQPLLGRWLEGDREVVLSYEIWKDRLGGDPGIIGRDVPVAGIAHRVAGVMPPGFSYPGGTEIWLFHGYGTPAYHAEYSAHNLNLVGRLKPGVTIQGAQAEAAAISARAAAAAPRDNEGWTTRVDGLVSEMTFTYRRAFVTLGIAVVIVLLIACANISNLLLASLEGRSSEMALRVAIGASRWNLFRQILGESLALAISGGALGLVFVMWGLDLLRPIIPANIPRADQIRADLPVALFSLAVSAVTGLVFAVLPGLQASEARLGDALRPGMGRSTSGGAGLRGGLVAVQVALAVVLLSAAGLLMNTLRRLAEQEPGFRTDHLLVAQIPLAQTRYPGSAQKVAFSEELLRRLSQRPGVLGAGIGFPLPFTGDQQGRTGVEVDGRPGFDPGLVQFRAATPGLLTALGVPLLQGRLFQDFDREGAPGVSIINSTLARKAFGTDTATGKRIRIDSGKPWLTVAGVVANVRQLGLDKDPGSEIYVPWFQNTFARQTLAVRYAGTHQDAAAALREAMLETDPNQPVGKMATMDELIAQSTAPRRFPLVLFSVFAALALGIAAVGIYGVVSHSVSRRTQEMGIRMALGASPGDLLRMILRQALLPVGIGLAGGLGLALIATRYLKSLLFEIRPDDPLTLALTCAVLVVVSAAAAFGPSLRACRADPVEALRQT